MIGQLLVRRAGGRSGLALRPVVVAGSALVIGVMGTIASWRVQGSTAMSLSPIATAVVLGAGWLLVLVGLEHLRRARRERFGFLLAGAGVAWLVASWANPAVGAPIVFTVGLVSAWLFPAALVHALVAIGGGPSDAAERALVRAGYLILGGSLGLIPALTFDAAATGCGACPANLIAVAPSVAISAGAVAVGSVLGVAWVVAAIVTLIRTTVVITPAARSRRVPVLVPAIAFLVTVALEIGRGAGRAAIPNDAAAQWLRLIEAVLLIATAAGVAVEWLDARRSRDRVARVVADLRNAGRVGGLKTALATTLRDPDLEIIYPVEGREVDADGNEIAAGGPVSGRARTPIVRDGVVVATLDHRADVLDAAATVDEVVRAARLGLEHERLQASTRSQLAEITAARKRIVATADAERRRLERDLHDGAQQHLIAIAIRLRLLAAELADDEEAAAVAVSAELELRLAIEELRDVAHGIYPSILADEGLAAALEGLAEGAAVPLSIDGLPLDRLDPAVEAAAYAVVVEALAASRSAVRVSGNRVAGDLVLVVSTDVLADDTLVDLHDRIGAADGRLEVSRDGAPGRVLLEVVMPCAS